MLVAGPSVSRDFNGIFCLPIGPMVSRAEDFGGERPAAAIAVDALLEAVKRVRSHKVHPTAEYGLVTRRAQAVGERGGLGREDPAVVEYADFAGVTGSHKAHPGRGAERVGTVNVREAGALLGQRVQVGGPDNRVAGAPHNVCVVLI